VIESADVGEELKGGKKRDWYTLQKLAPNREAQNRFGEGRGVQMGGCYERFWPQPGTVALLGG